MEAEQFTDCSIDLETLGTNEDAVILSLGAVVFNINEVDSIEDLETENRIFYAKFELGSQVAAGRTIDPDTVMWWMRQGAQARQAFEVGEWGDPAVVLSRFASWLESWGVTHLWGNGSGFDCNKTWSLAKTFGIELGGDPKNPRTGWWNDSDLRTLKRAAKLIAGYDGKDIPRGLEHHALADAVYQAQVAQRCWAALNSAPWVRHHG